MAAALADIVANLDAAGLRVEVGGPALEAAPADVVILDPTDADAVGAGSVVLSVGVRPDAGDALALVDAAAGRRAGAIVFRRQGELPRRLTALARSLGVCVLSAPAELTWGQLHSLLRTASAGIADHAGAAGAPVGDLFAVADAIAAAVGGPVTIEDPQWRILAFSNLDQPLDEARRQTILGRTPPEEWLRRLEAEGVLQALRTGDRPVRFEYAGLAPRLVAPVRAGAELLGSIWVAETGDALGDAALEELQAAAHAAAVHLLVHRAAADFERRSRGAFVRDVLAGRETSRPGGHVERPLAAVCFLPDADLERILSVVALYVDGLGPGATCAVVDDRIWALAPCEDAVRLRDLADRVVERVERLLAVPLRVAIGAPAPTAADLPRSRRTAELALGKLDGSGVVAYADVQAACELDELLALAVREGLLTAGPVAVLAEHDRRRRTQLCATLRVWLQLRDARAAAAALGIHPNTLRYRLRQANEICGLDGASADERLLAELQLRRLPTPA